MDILIGTKNQYKATEMVSFLGKHSGLNIHFWEELSLEIKVEEDQETLKKNAEKKAIEISRLTGWYVLASDGGVDIPGLGKKWDILRNQRVVGENKTDLEKADKLLDLMQGLKDEERKAAYHLALAIALKGRFIWSTEQISDRGYIVEKLPNREIPSYRWMGHVWYYPQHQKVFNLLSEKEKEDVRKQATRIKRELRKAIEEILEITNNSNKLKDLQGQRKKILEKIKNLEAIFKEEKDNEECWPGHSSTRYQTAGNELQVLTEILESIDKEINKNKK